MPSNVFQKTNTGKKGRKTAAATIGSNGVFQPRKGIDRGGRNFKKSRTVTVIIFAFSYSAIGVIKGQRRALASQAKLRG